MNDSSQHFVRTSQPRRYYFREGSAAFAHGIIGIEYHPQAHLPSHSPFSRLGQWLKGQSHPGPITALLIDNDKLHAWITPAYGEAFSRVREDGWANTEYHSKSFNDLFNGLKASYEALPGVGDKGFVHVFSHGQDLSFVPNDPESIAAEAEGRRQVTPQVGHHSRIVMRLDRPDRLLGLLHHLKLPPGAPIIDARDIEMAQGSLMPSYADRIDAGRAKTGNPENQRG